MRLLISITLLIFTTLLNVSTPVLAPNPAEEYYLKSLASRFPQVDRAELRNIEHIPSNIYVSPTRLLNTFFRDSY